MSSGGSQQRDSRFGVSNLEALLRYGDRGSPALGSDLFKLCPTSFSNARTRRLVTTHSFDITRPGLPPLIWDPTAQPYELAANSLFPTGNAVPAPQAGAAVPSGSEFSADWRSLAGALNRIDLIARWPTSPIATRRRRATPARRSTPTTPP